MVRLLLSFIIALHGMIHLMGFAREWKLGPAGKFADKPLIHVSDNGLKMLGILWLLACVLFIAASALYYIRKDYFWTPATLGLLLSQSLIILYWHDAKWGTVVNVLILVISIFYMGSFYFQSMVRQDIERLLKKSSRPATILTEENIANLPPVVQTWLSNAHVLGKSLPNITHITQKGSMRTDPSSEWLSFDADQYFSISPPAFVWNARVETDFLISITARDKYEDGKGNMLIKIGSLIPIANSLGKEIDQGTMLRFMAEMIWFPQAVTSPYLSWQQTGPRHAKVIMHYQNVSAEGFFTFNAEGFPTQFEAQRYGEFNGKFSKETWSIAITNYSVFNGMRIADACDVTWKLKDGDFSWLKLTVLNIDSP